MPRQLIAGERLLLPPVRHHWILLVQELAAPATVTLLLLVLVGSATRGLLPADVRLLCVVAALAAFGLWCVTAWLRWTEDSLTLTDQRVILETGVLRRTSVVIPLGRVQDVVTRQGLLGRLLDYGTVEIEAAGAGLERFDRVGSPERLRDSVFVVTGRVGTGV
jgi:uncharacterized membrane protein YdbT with pleckstrin-like domain